MKRVVSIPDHLFRAAEELAAQWGISRSELYAKALSAFLEKHNDELMISRLNAIYGPEGENSHVDETLAMIQGHTLKTNN